MPLENSSPKISIIIPIFNAENYLPDCLNSIASQSYKNLEIILVDDGSTDRSHEICEEFIKIEKRAKLLFQENSGVARARSLGLTHANGHFIIHADSDDILPPKALSSLLDASLKNQCDISIGSYLVRRPSGDKLIEINECKTGSELLQGLLTGAYHGGLWNKLIKKSLYDNLDFTPNLDFMEDKLILTKMLIRGEYKICCTREPVYIYNQRRDSYTNRMSERSLRTCEIVTNEICEIVSGIFDKEFIQGIKNLNRLIILLNSEQPLTEFNREKDLHILKDKNISLLKKIPIWWLSKRISLPLAAYKTIFKILRPTH